MSWWWLIFALGVYWLATKLYDEGAPGFADKHGVTRPNDGPDAR